MKKLLTCLTALSIGGLALSACATNAPATQPSSSSKLQSSLSAEQMMAYLTADNKLGRATGSAPMVEIQQWLVEQFEQIGIKPLPKASSLIQSFEAKTKQGNVQAANIIGYLDCRCDNERYFVIGAHYDHVGVNPKLEGDQIFNGADDDASGVVASLLIARELAKAEKLPFNIIIAAWDAEELGLQGSKYFVQNPLVDLSKIESGVMFELVGSKSEKNTAWMTGFAYSSLYPILKQQMAQQGWQLGEDPFAQQMLFLRSDNAAFALMDLSREKREQVFRQGQKADIQGIPMHAISIWKGQQHYHQVNDDMSVIDIENLTNFSKAVAEAIKNLPENIQVEWLENPYFNFKRP
ncbi:M28 family metallopeptidase [Kangiella sp. TOML190]|uniref:M28 family metallopeptidase n=1 Tax=Kangiella sp. TOML190 TaxID=2931351 RepID=UPI0020416302|nr:M20/M25/M40 family metallo-hydrolase [Kangiella sp. TOML190]